MTHSTVGCTREGPLALIVLRRPQAGNAFDGALRAELSAALDSVATDDAIRCVVIGAEGRHFCTGADLKEAASPESQDIERQIRIEYRPIFDAITNMPKPVIAPITGTAAGACVSLAAACDLRVMADDAALVLPFSRIGLVTDCALSWWLVHHLGYARAYELAIEAQSIDASSALAAGIVNRVVPRAQVMQHAKDWAVSLSARAPLALAATKRAMRHALVNGPMSTFDEEAKLQRDCATSADHREGVTAFLEKREPVFTGKTR